MIIIKNDFIVGEGEGCWVLDRVSLSIGGLVSVFNLINLISEAKLQKSKTLKKIVWWREKKNEMKAKSQPTWLLSIKQLLRENATVTTVQEKNVQKHFFPTKKLPIQ